MGLVVAARRYFDAGGSDFLLGGFLAGVARVSTMLGVFCQAWGSSTQSMFGSLRGRIGLFRRRAVFDVLSLSACLPWIILRMMEFAGLAIAVAQAVSGEAKIARMVSIVSLYLTMVAGPPQVSVR